MSATSPCPTSPSLSLPLLCGHDRGSPQRDVLERYIHERYAETYQADIQQYLPFLMATWSDDMLQGVLGLRPGACGPFYVEHYLDLPVEQFLSHRLGVSIERPHIIETGNLAGSRGSSQLLFIALTEVLYRAGFRWVTFTATAQVNALLQRLGFAPQHICRADPDRLGPQKHVWGTYYENEPSVVVGNVEQAHDTLRRNEFALKLLSDHAIAISAIVAQLRCCAAVNFEGKDEVNADEGALP